MKDFSFWKEYEGCPEGSGRSEKIWLMNPDNNQIGLFKYKKDEGTTDHVSECMAYNFAQLIGIPCAKFELGTYKGREGSISYNILNSNDEVLFEGINYISVKYPQYNTEEFFDPASGDVYSLEMIRKVIDGVIEFKDFLCIPIFDYLIGNTDRHQSNWAIIQKGNTKKLSPLYDNSSSLCAYLSDDQMKGYTGKDQMRWKSLVDTKSKSLIRCTVSDKTRPTHMQVMKYIREHYYNESVTLVKKIISVMTEENINDILNLYSERDLKEIKKTIIRRFLIDKTEGLKHLYFGKEE